MVDERHNVGMISRDSILKIIYDVAKETNEEQPADRQLKTTPDTVLFGQGSVLDSLGLVGLVVAVEAKIEQAFSTPVALTDDRAMSQRNSPFRTIGSLAEYIETLLNEAKNG